MKGMVLDIETRIDRAALASSRRKVAPREMPTGLQTIAAAAMLEFTVDADGICDDFALTSVDRMSSGEPALVAAVEGRLAELADQGGALVTFNGAHDLGIMRLSAARLHRFEHAASSRWLNDGPGRHEDVMLEFSAGGRQSWPRLDDLAASFGITSMREVVLVTGSTGVERMKCELDVVVTMMLYLHVLAERTRSKAPLLRGTVGLMHMMEDRLADAPHFRTALRGNVFAAAGRR